LPCRPQSDRSPPTEPCPKRSATPSQRRNLPHAINYLRIGAVEDGSQAGQIPCHAGCKITATACRPSCASARHTAPAPRRLKPSARQARMLIRGLRHLIDSSE
jgi:hypothetical protein